jgi:hypothetical protein
MTAETSVERFPIRERLATNLDDQLAWLVREAVWSRDKTNGYEEKLARLSRKPGSQGSTLDFLRSYCWRSVLFDKELLNTRSEAEMKRAAQMALQMKGKMVAFLVDKVALAYWLEEQAAGACRSNDELLEAAHTAVLQKAKDLHGLYSDDQLLRLVHATGYVLPEETPPADTIINPLLQAPIDLAETYAHNNNDTAKLADIAIEASAMGALMAMAYARQLTFLGYSAELPKPGLASGYIEPWV